MTDLTSRSAKPIHLVLRYGDSFLEIEDTIAEHRHVLEEQGAVWFGKLGKPLARRHIDRINKQCDQGRISYLFLVKRRAGKLEVHRGRIVEVARALPEQQKTLVPAYYRTRGITSQMHFWIKLSKLTRVRPASLGEWHVASSGTSLPRSLAKSMAAMFVIAEGRGLNV